MYSAESAHQASQSSSGSWGSDYKPPDSIVDQYGPYEDPGQALLFGYF